MYRMRYEAAVCNYILNKLEQKATNSYIHYFQMQMFH